MKPGSLNTKKKGCKVDQCDKVDLHYRQLWLDEDEQSDQLSEVSVKTQKGKQPTITTYKIKKLSSWLLLFCYYMSGRHFYNK